MMARISAGSCMTAITDILFPHTGQRNGLPLCALHTAAAQGIDIIDHGQKACPCLPAVDRGHLMNFGGFSGGRRLCGSPTVPVLGRS
jgi:hypothetical protein